MLDHTAGDDARILVVNPAAAGADGALAMVIGGNAQLDAAATAWTKFHGSKVWP
jgi:hypothetical protein